MTFEEWLHNVPKELTGDPLWHAEVYRIALFACDLAWSDAKRLVKGKRTIGLADQLCHAIGSIGANIAEGYSRRSRADQARFYEYALGSAREARVWYYHGRHVLPEAVIEHRLQALTQIVRLLLRMIPDTRGTRLTEEHEPYDVTPALSDSDPPVL